MSEQIHKKPLYSVSNIPQFDSIPIEDSPKYCRKWLKLALR